MARSDIRRGMPLAERRRMVAERNAVAVRLIAEFGRADLFRRKKPDGETAHLILQLLLPEMDPASSDARAVADVLALSPQALVAYCRAHRGWVQSVVESTHMTTPRRLHAAAS